MLSPSVSSLLFFLERFSYDPSKCQTGYRAVWYANASWIIREDLYITVSADVALSLWIPMRQRRLCHQADDIADLAGVFYRRFLYF